MGPQPARASARFRGAVQAVPGNSHPPPPIHRGLLSQGCFLQVPHRSVFQRATVEHVLIVLVLERRVRIRLFNQLATAGLGEIAEGQIDEATLADCQKAVEEAAPKWLDQAVTNLVLRDPVATRVPGRHGGRLERYQPPCTTMALTRRTPSALTEVFRGLRSRCHCHSPVLAGHIEGTGAATKKRAKRRSRSLRGC